MPTLLASEDEFRQECANLRTPAVWGVGTYALV